MSDGPAALLVAERLRELHPDAKYELDFETPFQLLVATILAARCTDERVNRVTKVLFPKYPDPASLAEAEVSEVEEIVRPTGSYKTKAKAIIGTAQGVLDLYGGQVPQTVDELVKLPGVARKTANVVLTMAYAIPSGIIVDAHVARCSQIMGLSSNTKAEKIEQDLMAALPQDEWINFGAALVLHGRYVCKSKAPRCGECVFDDVCPKIGVA